MNSSQENRSDPTSVPRETRQTRSRQALQDALLMLLEAKSFEQVTVRDITAQAQVGYTTFFRHYPDKEAVLKDLVADQIRELISMALPLLYTADSRASARALCAYVWEHRVLWTVLLTGGAAGLLKDQLAMQALQYSVSTVKGAARIPSELRVLVPVTATVEILAWWLRQDDPFSVDRMADLVDELVVAPIIASSQRAEFSPSK